MTDTNAVLVLNAGSSSLKASLLAADGRTLWREQRACPIAQGAEPEAVLEAWLPEALAPLGVPFVLAAHRVVHGGERFTAPTRLTPEVIGAVEALVPLAPLHNGPALRVIRWLQSWHPALPQWACFDTAFHSTLPPEARTYAIPGEWRRQGLRRFGFHGLNHQHIAETVSARRGDGSFRLISAHLGAGCSLCAIRDGRSIATTMGFTPLEGLVMASRSGSVDPGLLLHQLRRGVTPEQLDRALNDQSGLLGLSELSGDMRTLRQAASAGHPGAQLAIDVFRHQLLQGIGAMAACLGGVDLVVLTGGIGEHDEDLFRELEEALGWLEPFELLRIPADEEGLIARSCRAAQQSCHEFRTPTDL